MPGADEDRREPFARVAAELVVAAELRKVIPLALVPARRLLKLAARLARAWVFVPADPRRRIGRPLDGRPGSDRRRELLEREGRLGSIGRPWLPRGAVSIYVTR